VIQRLKEVLARSGGYYYYFSPAGVNVLWALMKFWEGYEVSEPTNLGRLQFVI